MSSARAERVEPIAGPTGLVALGALIGLAWAASLRGLMSVLAGMSSTVEWWGTFVEILAPAAIVGGLFGWAEYLRRFDGPTWRRWFVLAPLVFVLGALTDPDGGAAALAGAGGALVVAATGLTGGYALSGLGPILARALAGLVAVVPIVVFVMVVASSAGAEFALSRPRGSWVTVYFSALLVVFYLACAIPLRRAPRTAAA